MQTTKRHLPWILATVLLAAVPLPGFAQQPPPAEGDEAALVAVLESADAALFDKAKACQQLAVVGTKNCVPVLAGLLDDEKLSHYARFALEPIPDPSVDVVLRDALDKTEGGLLVGVINSIGIRQDAKAVDTLKKLMGSADDAVAAAAAGALGRIHTPEAVRALQAALAGPQSRRVAVADACSTAADMLLAEDKAPEAAALYDAMRQAELPEFLQLAALHGAIRARGEKGIALLVECLKSEDKRVFQTGLRMAHEIGGPEVAKALIGELNLPEVEEPAEDPGGVVIKKAEYGAGDRWVDVTEKVAAAAQSGTPIEASNNLAGDPAQGSVKSLRIVFTKDGQQHTVEVPEKEQITLEGVVAGEPHPRQVLLLNALGDLGQTVATPVILEAAQSGAWDVRRAAFRVLGKLGDPKAAPMLLAAALEEGGPAQIAREALAELEGEEVDAAIASALAEAKGKKRVVLIGLVGARGITAAAPALKQAAGDEDPEVALAAVRALGTTVSLDDLSVLIDPLVKPGAPEKAAAAKDALKRAVLRMPDRDATAAKLLAPMAQASSSAKVDLLDLLGTVGGKKALEGVTAAAKGGSDELQDAATRVLGGWMSADAAPVLLELAKTGNEKYRVRCLRGYIRIPRQLDVPAPERIAMCRDALAAATRPQEKALALEVLGRYPSAASLAVVAPYLDDPKLKAPAAAAAVAIAEKIVDTHPGPVAEAVQKAADVATDAEVAGKARALLRRAKSRSGGK